MRCAARWLAVALMTVSKACFAHLWISIHAGKIPLLQDTRRYGPGGILASACARNR